MQKFRTGIVFHFTNEQHCYNLMEFTKSHSIPSVISLKNNMHGFELK